MDQAGTVVELLARWRVPIGVVVLFVAVWFFGSGRRAGSPAPAGYGCLVAMVVTLLFYVVVIF